MGSYLRNKIEKLKMVISEDNIPSVICSNCALFIEKIFAFFEKAHSSEKVLSRLYNGNSNPDKLKRALTSFKSEKSNTNIPETNMEISHYDQHSSIPEDNACDNTDTLNYSVKYEDNQFESPEIRVENFKHAPRAQSKNFDKLINYTHKESLADKVLNCSKCDQKFVSKKDLINHGSDHKISCLICKKNILPKSLEGHMKKHTDLFRCSKCKLRHSSKAALEKHFKALHTDVKGYVCHICGKQNSCQASMNRHLATHLKNRPFKCNFCNFSTKSKTVLNVHISRKHTNETTDCNVCEKPFKSKLSLGQHKKRMHTPKKYRCNHCGKQFREKFNLNKHTLKKHVYQRIYECKVCQHEFLTSQNLKNHMHTHRTNCKSCSKCGKVFSYKKYLEKHLLKCTSEKLNICKLEDNSHKLPLISEN